MIVKIFPSGTSFKGLATYLSRDVKAQTSERVAWTHTLNCVHDDLPSAVDEMLWTARQAAYLKAEAGIPAGGRPVEKPVKHVTLSWHVSEQPTREQMIAAVESYANHMGYAEHEAVLIAHDDRPHPHVHVMLNRINPSDGTAMDDGYDKRRSQEWALGYEREHGQIFCEQRLVSEAEREKSPTRPAWEALKDSEQQHEAAEIGRRNFDREYFAREENSKIIQGEEWKILKAHQREEREAYFADGKQAFSELRKEIYREVREEFREEWAGFYDAKREGADADALREMKADILARQNALLDDRRDAASAELREARDGEYRQILDLQNEARGDLADRQETGLRSYGLLEHSTGEARPAENSAGGEEIRSDGFERGEYSGIFRSAAEEICEPAEPDFRISMLGDEIPGMTGAENPRMRDGPNMAADLGSGLIGGLANFGEKLFDGFLGGDAPKLRPEPTPSAPPRQREYWETVRDNPFMRVAEAARQEAIRQDEETRSRAWWDDRERSRD